VIADAWTQILEVLDDHDGFYISEEDAHTGQRALADRLLELFNKLDEYNRCDFDCDNCHMGGCGNPTCDRGMCPEENAKHEF
jgi:hypothetical protein